jgi:hypothetical protein
VNNGGQNRWRTLLVLGRVSNLPTVWSNCLAGWLLGGGGPVMKLLLVCFGTSCLYVGGMYLNDAFDANFDREYRKERPIPSGAITLAEVWRWGVFWILLGAASLSLLGWKVATLALLLALAILLYDAVHKMIVFSPVLMAACRFLVYLVAATAAARGVDGLTLWSAIVLGLYVVGLSYIARKESARGILHYWPAYLLAAPVLLAALANEGIFQRPVAQLAFIFIVWVLFCLRFSYWTSERNVGRTVSGLLAGIVWVDLLAVAGAPSVSIAILFVAFFLAALFAQRFVPAT